MGNAVGTLVAVGLAWASWVVYHRFFESPRRVLRLLRSQGIPGLPFRPLLGNIPELIQVEKRRSSDSSYAASTHAAHFLIETTSSLGPLWSFCLGPSPNLVVADPGLIKEILGWKHEGMGLIKNRAITDSISILGEGLVSANQGAWRKQRRLLNPSFSTQEIKRLFPTMLECTESALNRMDASRKPNESLRIEGEMSRLTLDIVARCAFGMHLQQLEEEGMMTQQQGEGGVMTQLLDAFTEYMGAVGTTQQLAFVSPLLMYLPIKANRQVWRSERVIRKVMTQIVSSRIEKHKESSREEPNKISARAEMHKSSGTVNEEKVDLLELMLQATELQGNEKGASEGMHVEDSSVKGKERAEESDQGGSERGAVSAVSGGGGALTMQLLMDNSITFMLAGHETTANLLTWTVMLLATHPEWQERARAEVLSATLGHSSSSPSPLPPPPLSSPTPSPSPSPSHTSSAVAKAMTFEKLGELKVVGWVLNEALRLYPPAVAVGRIASEPTKLSESLTIPKGCDVFIPIAAVHRSKELWGDNAEDFFPGRFEAGVSKAAKHPSAFMPFSLGPRNCIGQSFALSEAKAILALLLARFSWRLDESYIHHSEINVTLKPKFGMPVVLTRVP